MRASKLVEFLGVGVPVVTYDYEVADDIRRADAGVIVSTPTAFVDAVVRLAGDEDERDRLAENAARAGLAFDWDVVTRAYADMLDRYLARAG